MPLTCLGVVNNTTWRNLCCGNNMTLSRGGPELITQCMSAVRRIVQILDLMDCTVLFLYWKVHGHPTISCNAFHRNSERSLNVTWSSTSCTASLYWWKLHFHTPQTYWMHLRFLDIKGFKLYHTYWDILSLQIHYQSRNIEEFSKNIWNLQERLESLFSSMANW